jgi:hypothetical protein
MIIRVYGDFDGFWRFWARKIKAKQTQSRLAPRPVLGVENEFEKTNPIYLAPRFSGG